MSNPVDGHNRRFEKLRVSLTSRCNFACTYCVDEMEGMGVKGQRDKDVSREIKKSMSLDQIIDSILSLNEICHFKNIRLTGGEPLLYNELFYVIERLNTGGIKDIRLTTNGFFLKLFAEKLSLLGVLKVNVSMDAIDNVSFFKITKKNNLKEVILGIEEALLHKIEVKVNSVIMKGINEDQILPLLNFAKNRNIVIRFLELMGMGHLYKNFHDLLFTENDILDIIKAKYHIAEKDRPLASTANYWGIMGSDYQFGIISNVSRPFCHDCDRLRLDSNGRLYGCISHKNGLDISKVYKDKPNLELLLEKALRHKQKIQFQGSLLSMKGIGG